jgi:hypothetical protein
MEHEAAVYKFDVKGLTRAQINQDLEERIKQVKAQGATVPGIPVGTTIQKELDRCYEYSLQLLESVDSEGIACVTAKLLHVTTRLHRMDKTSIIARRFEEIDANLETVRQCLEDRANKTVSVEVQTESYETDLHEYTSTDEDTEQELPHTSQNACLEAKKPTISEGAPVRCSTPETTEEKETIGPFPKSPKKVRTSTSSTPIRVMPPVAVEEQFAKMFTWTEWMHEKMEEWEGEVPDDALEAMQKLLAARATRISMQNDRCKPKNSNLWTKRGDASDSSDEEDDHMQGSEIICGVEEESGQ